MPPLETPPTKTAEEIEAEKLAAEPKTPTNEEQTALNDLASDMLGVPRQKKEPKPKKKEPTGEEEPPKPKVKKKEATPEPQPVDYEAIAEAAGRGAATAMKPKPEPEKKPDAKGEFDDVPEKERRKIPVLQQMEQMFPDRYKGIAKKYADSIKPAMEYQSKWEEENPGKEFDPDDEEHNAFFSKYPVDWEDDDFIEAKAEIVAGRHVKAIEEKTGKKLGELEQREKAREQEPLAYREAKRVGRDVFKSLGDQFKDVVGDDGSVNRQAVQKIFDSDPLAGDIIFQQVGRIENLCAESFRLHNGMVEYNPSNPDHKFIAEFAVNQEKEILALPKAQQLNEQGQKFSKTSDFNEMSAEQQSKHYRLLATDLHNLLAAELGHKAKVLLEQERKRFDGMAGKYGYKKGETQEQEPDGEPTDEAVDEDDKPTPVTTTPDSVVPSTERHREHTPASSTDALFKQLIA